MSLSAHLSTLITHYGNLAIFVLMALESVCIPIPSEVVLPFAGYEVYVHDLHFWPVVVVATLANLTGGALAYAIGRYGGRPFVLRYGRYILLSERHLDRADEWFARRGEVTVLIGRLVPAVRTFISLPAGVARMPFGRFLLFSAIGALPWNIAVTYAGLQLATQWTRIDKELKPLTYIGVVVLVTLVIWFWFGQRRRSRISKNP